MGDSSRNIIRMLSSVACMSQGLSGQSWGGPEEAAWTFCVPIKFPGDPLNCQSYVNRVGLPKSGPESLSSETLFPPLTRDFLMWQGTFTCRCSSGGCNSLEEGWGAVSSTPVEPEKRFLTPINEPAPLPAMRPWNITGVYVQKQTWAVSSVPIVLHVCF